MGWLSKLVNVQHQRKERREGVRANDNIRSRYEGLSLRLRVDLKAAGRATDPNVVSLDGVGYPSERSPILFSALDTVYVQSESNVTTVMAIRIRT